MTLLPAIVLLSLGSVQKWVDSCRSVLPGIVRILDQYLDIVEPHLDRIMERMDRIEPHLPYILLHLVPGLRLHLILLLFCHVLALLRVGYKVYQSFKGFGFATPLVRFNGSWRNHPDVLILHILVTSRKRFQALSGTD